MILKVKSKTGNYISQLILLIGMLIFMEGCTSTPDNASSTQSASTTEVHGVVTQMNVSETASASGIENLINMVKADLSQRLSVSIDQISLVESQEVEWSDSSLGCPQADMSYIQVITPGYRIVLQVSGQQYEYHSNKDRYFLYCENPNSPILPQP